jgi:hypothetical protein
MNQKNSLMTSLRKKLTLSTSIYGKRCFVNKCSIAGFVVDQHQKYVTRPTRLDGFLWCWLIETTVRG